MTVLVVMCVLQYNHNRIEVVRAPDVAAKYLKDPEVFSVAFVREPLARLMSMVRNSA